MIFNRKEADELQAELNKVTAYEVGYASISNFQQTARYSGRGGPGVSRNTNQKGKHKPNLGKMRRCTIDGVKVYPSGTALVKELGRGVNGAGHPDFRYIDDTIPHD